MPDFSPRLLRSFVQTVSAELGTDTLSAVLDKAGLSLLLADPSTGSGRRPAAVARLDASAAAHSYAGIQQSLRVYYGRGARGILLRVGAQFWKRLLNEASLTLKPQIPIARGLSTAARPKPALDLLARLLSFKAGDITVHTLDLDLLLVDHVSPTTYEQRDDESICWVTMGLMRESLFWAAGREYDITETSCRANGAGQCEFHIKTV
ncbi:MAG: 4-vinyl reductase [Chloroflexota bacterium]